MPRIEQVGRGRGDEIGLSLRLGPDLGVDARAQVDRERDTERHDREQQHV